MPYWYRFFTGLRCKTHRSDSRRNGGEMKMDAGAGDGAGREYHVSIAGDAFGSVVVGDHNLVVDARHGSTVSVVAERERPRPVRRDQVRLLPRRQSVPLGREADLLTVRAAVEAGGVVQLHGPAGIGTSTLLRRVARDAHPSAGGVVYLDARSRDVADLAQEIFEICYDAGGYAPSAAELRRLMSGVDVTVYLDNADLSAEQVRLLADSAPDATFVLASHTRSLLGGDGVAIELKGLDHNAGLRLLLRELGELPSEESAAAMTLWQTTQGRPLFLLRAAALARPSGTAPVRLPRPAEVEDLAPLLLDQLSASQTTVLQLLATLDADLEASTIGSIAGMPKAQDLCEHLVRLGLVIADNNGYRCAADVISVVEQRMAEAFSIEQICRYFIGWAEQSATTPEQVAARSRALERAVELACAEERAALAVRLARTASPKLARSLQHDAWSRMLGLGWRAAEAAGDKEAATYFLHEEGVRSLLRGHYIIAAVILGEAVQVWLRLGHSQGASAAQQASGLLPPNLPPAVPAPTVPAHALPAHAGAASVHSATPSAATHMANLSGPLPHGSTAFVPTTPAPAPAPPPAIHPSPVPKPHTPPAVHKAAVKPVSAAVKAGHVAATVPAASAAGVSAAVVAKVIAVIAVVVGVASSRAIVTHLEEALSKPSATDLSGNWQTPVGPVSISSEGSGSYSFTSCKRPVRFTGSGGVFSGQMSIYDSTYASCGPTVGTATLRIIISPDGTSATASEGSVDSSGGGSVTCYICGTWTRIR